MKKRWEIYLLVGFLFGVIDFYYQNWMMQLNVGRFLLIILVLGIWLVVAVPAAWYEASQSRAVWLSATASVIVWSSAVVSYYLYLVAKLVLIGEPSRPWMHISNRQDPYFWTNVWAIFKGAFTDGIFGWLPLALIGGGLVGLVVGFLVTRRINRTEGIRN